jgi:2-isopropylmalate synthase
MTLFSQGIDPELDITDIDALRRTAEYCNRLPVHERHPYVGDLVYTAFSGSHQDAIKKGFAALYSESEARGRGRDYELWGVPYLPIDPAHVGRSYEAVIRVNSQSGKGGIAYIMETEHGFSLPRRLQIEFSKTIQTVAEDTGTEITPLAMWHEFQAMYLPAEPRLQLRSQQLVTHDGDRTTITAQVVANGEPVTVQGDGNGPIAAFVAAIRDTLGVELDVVDYHEHSLDRGADAGAVAYVETVAGDTTTRWGIGTDPNIITASLRAVLSAASRILDDSSTPLKLE